MNLDQRAFDRVGKTGNKNQTRGLVAAILLCQKLLISVTLYSTLGVFLNPINITMQLPGLSSQFVQCDTLLKPTSLALHPIYTYNKQAFFIHMCSCCSSCPERKGTPHCTQRPCCPSRMLWTTWMCWSTDTLVEP